MPAEPTEGARLAREALARARESAAAARLERERAGGARRRAAIRKANEAEHRQAPAAPSGPVRFGAAIDDLLNARGWSASAASARVTGDWAGIVGEDLAGHCAPVSLRDGVLTLEAESTAWATQVRLLAATVLARIADSVGAGVVTRLVVRGPTGPSWKHGRLSVRGPGPRDTYG